MPYEEDLVPPPMVKEVVRDSEAAKCMSIQSGAAQMSTTEVSVSAITY